MLTLHRGKLLLLTLFLILALSHPYLQSDPQSVVKITVIKRNLIDTEISSHDDLSEANVNALAESKDQEIQETPTQENALAGGRTQETQETTLNYYSAEQSNSFSTFEWATPAFVSFVGYTILLHQILGDI
jgi:hypothetical protein